MWPSKLNFRGAPFLFQIQAQESKMDALHRCQRKEHEISANYGLTLDKLKTKKMKNKKENKKHDLQSFSHNVTEMINNSSPRFIFTYSIISKTRSVNWLVNDNSDLGWKLDQYFQLLRISLVQAKQLKPNHKVIKPENVK